MRMAFFGRICANLRPDLFGAILQHFFKRVQEETTHHCGLKIGKKLKNLQSEICDLKSKMVCHRKSAIYN
jgi:hypothetical protein